MFNTWPQEIMISARCILGCTCVSCWTSAPCFMETLELPATARFEHVCSNGPKPRRNYLCFFLIHVVESTCVQRLKHAGVRTRDNVPLKTQHNSLQTRRQKHICEWAVHFHGWAQWTDTWAITTAFFLSTTFFFFKTLLLSIIITLVWLKGSVRSRQVQGGEWVKVTHWVGPRNDPLPPGMTTSAFILFSLLLWSACICFESVFSVCLHTDGRHWNSLAALHNICREGENHISGKLRVRNLKQQRGGERLLESFGLKNQQPGNVETQQANKPSD